MLPLAVGAVIVAATAAAAVRRRDDARVDRRFAVALLVAFLGIAGSLVRADLARVQFGAFVLALCALGLVASSDSSVRSLAGLAVAVIGWWVGLHFVFGFGAAAIVCFAVWRSKDSIGALGGFYVAFASIVGLLEIRIRLLEPRRLLLEPSLQVETVERLETIQHILVVGGYALLAVLAGHYVRVLRAHELPRAVLRDGL